MRVVFVDQDSARVGLYKTVLDGAGIPSYVRNQCTNNFFTDMPCPVFFPALCVMHDEHYDDAMRILSEYYYGPATVGKDWQCAGCKEEVPGTFDFCWHCGASRPGLVAEASGPQAGDSE